MTLRISFQNLENSKVERNFFKCKQSLREIRLFSYRKKNKLPLYFHPAPSPIVRSIRRSEIHTRIYRQTERKRQKWRRKRRRNRFLESGGIDGWMDGSIDPNGYNVIIIANDRKREARRNEIHRERSVRIPFLNAT